MISMILLRSPGSSCDWSMKNLERESEEVKDYIPVRGLTPSKSTASRSTSTSLPVVGLFTIQIGIKGKRNRYLLVVQHTNTRGYTDCAAELDFHSMVSVLHHIMIKT